MGIEEVNKIKEFFLANHIKPIYLEHGAVITSEDAAKTRGFELRQGIKAIVIANENKFTVVDIPADKKADIKKVAELMGWSKSKTRMATSEEVMKITNCEIGAVPPFGHKETLPIFVDTGVYDNQENAFNIGLRTHSVKVKTKDMKVVFSKVNAVEGTFSK